MSDCIERALFDAVCNERDRLFATKADLLAALTVVRMSRGWHELTLDTRVLVDDAIAKAKS